MSYTGVIRLLTIGGRTSEVGVSQPPALSHVFVPMIIELDRAFLQLVQAHGFEHAAVDLLIRRFFPEVDLAEHGHFDLLVDRLRTVQFGRLRVRQVLLTWRQID